jgi:hypothetical protein
MYELLTAITYVRHVAVLQQMSRSLEAVVAVRCLHMSACSYVGLGPSVLYEVLRGCEPV